MRYSAPIRVLVCAVFGASAVVNVAQAQFGGATAAPAKPVTAPAKPAAETPYDIASKLYESGKQKEALVILQQLAAAGDARAQYLVGLDLLEAVYLPRDNAQGLAYLLLAGEDKMWGDLVAPRARAARALVEPQLSGPELIRADAIVGAYRAQHPPAK